MERPNDIDRPLSQVASLAKPAAKDEEGGGGTYQSLAPQR